MACTTKVSHDGQDLSFAEVIALDGEAALPKNEAHTRRLKTHLSALDHGREWVTKSPLRQKNTPSPAGHFGRCCSAATAAAAATTTPLRHPSHFTAKAGRNGQGLSFAEVVALDSGRLDGETETEQDKGQVDRVIALDGETEQDKG
jgi:hypothetical protein